MKFAKKIFNKKPPTHISAASFNFSLCSVSISKQIYKTSPSKNCLVKDVSVNCKVAVSHRNLGDNATTPEAIYLIFFLPCKIVKQRELRKSHLC